MKKQTSVIIFFVSFAFLIITIYSKKSYLSDSFRCEGDIYTESKNNSFFDGDLQFFINHGNGFVRVAGIVDNENEESTISRVVYFSIKKTDNQHLLLSSEIVKSKTDNVSNADLMKILPMFYVSSKNLLGLYIVRTKKGNVFYTSDLPSLYCRNM